MDKIANTCGHYDAYRQGVEFDRSLELSVPEPEPDLNMGNHCYNEDANELVKKIKADLIYIDPPYNSRQYCDAYHLLENVAAWRKPKVFGIAKKMDRSKLKSDYCTKKAKDAFEALIENIDAKYILLSYNNMAEKGNGRSNAKITDADILGILGKKGEVKIFSEEYKAFTTGKSDIKENEERLFLCVCRNPSQVTIKSPFNYTGGKFKLLPQLLPLFPKKIDFAIDLFCGGGDVGINLDCKKVLFRDRNKRLIDLFVSFQTTGDEATFEALFSLIEQYALSRTDLYGYGFYGCNGGDGLAAYNKEKYLRLRSDYNAADKRGKEHNYCHMLYLLLVYAFNNQIRFNTNGEFNLPVGKRDFNTKMQMKLRTFLARMKRSDWCFQHGDFRSLDIDNLPANTLVYADPPYLITCASYNEKNGWTEADERDLLALLDRLDSRKIKFALSNVLESKSSENRILKEWVSRNSKKYHVMPLAISYANSNYHRNDRESPSYEVLVMNYERP
jgi:adenine-specific DNA-methyltransferase